VKSASLKDEKILANVMESLDEILKLDDYLGLTGTDQSIALMLEKMGGLDALEDLQKQTNFALYQQANYIL